MEKNKFRAVIKHLHMKGLTSKEIKAEWIIFIGHRHITVISILNEQLGMKKLSARWVPRLLTVDHKRNCVTISKQCLVMFQRNPDEFLRRFITLDETWMHYFTLETKEQEEGENREVGRKGEGLPINGDYYAALLDCFNNILKKKRSYLAKKKVLFHQDSARVHTCPAPMAKFNEFRYELLPHPAHSPDLVSCDYFLFSNLKK
ncbi:SETMR methyltransferase, partial [Acromyrmex insinuator]